MGEMTSLDIGLWAALVVLLIVWVGVFYRFRAEHMVWKTKKDFDFDELDKVLAAQDYKHEVGKYLHKYKSDRRSYENRMARLVAFLAVAGLLGLADAAILLVRLAF
ncbi:MAG: hypothetical protein GF418_05835 [Chitinivibrionales bacterium]|nr:hypothetical protein [Chitinivibrionales bacterium]MBD3395131.1 hypothetical protein [Chitinivibrionales bacterium]